ncbi:methyltransferase domain-containing protein [Hyphomonas johnsonii]|uniref:Uncharacterized protein n=1 Tax=Hyphomonas johnsonii MHS-2 TaxID=1280950 RepID=A0A059FQ34_9PROT|nr:methyltransferase domain-containing protein [Hyphomonas johnsonii]KCZ92795.1 hypothetical protein HJO_07567 [Hyphomonas johnsonii MHS-2]
MKYVISAILAGSIAVACAAPVPASLDAPVIAEMPAFDYSSVFGADDRPAADYDDYGVRKSGQVLAFIGVTPGMTVVDLEAGGGLYTELFSRVVGDTGTVYMQNPPEFDAFLGDSVAKRVDGRLANVTKVRKAFDDLSDIPDASADIVTWLLGPHELWFTPDGAEPGVLGDPTATFSEIARVTRPGGHLVILEHSAPAGSPATTGGTTHRLDRAITVGLAEAAGFSLVKESDIFANPDDDGTLNVFDPSIRRKTDRYLLKFEKN